MIRLANRTRVRSARYARYLYPVLFILLDYIAILLAEQEALGLHHLIDRHTAPYAIAPQYIYLWIPLIFILFLGQAHAYRQMHSILDSSRDVFFAVLYGFMACLLVIYFAAAGPLTSRLFVGLFIVLLVPNLYLIRYLAKMFIKKCHLFYEPVILVGAGKTAERVLRYNRNDLGYRYDIVGLIDDDPLSEKVASRFLLYGKVADAESIMEGLMRHRVVDDARFARSVVHDKVAFERRGRLYLRQYLAARRIPSATIADALAEIDEDAYRENIKHVLQSRLRSKSDLAETFEGRTKVFRYGVSRGYEPGLVSETLKALLVK